MSHGCRTELPETLQPTAVDGLDQVTVPIEVTTDGSRYLVSLRNAELGELAELIAPGQALRGMHVYGGTRYLSYDKMLVGDLVLEQD